jgi:hypothetical protein
MNLTSGITTVAKPTRNPAIAQAALALQPGGRARIRCPECGGSDSDKASLSMFRRLDGQVVYKCFRATCSARGAIRLGHTDMDGHDRLMPIEQAINPFTGESGNLPGDIRKKMIEKYGLSNWIVDETELDWTTQFGGSLVSPVYGPVWDTTQQVRRGVVVRPFPGSVGYPKTINHREVALAPFIGYFAGRNFSYIKRPKRVIVVEDFISAMKVADAINPTDADICVAALNGSSISKLAAWELADVERIDLALDKDAFPAAVKYKILHGPIWNEVVVWRLEKDLKYVPQERIREALYAGKSDFVGDHKEQGELRQGTQSLIEQITTG